MLRIWTHCLEEGNKHLLKNTYQNGRRHFSPKIGLPFFDTLVAVCSVTEEGSLALCVATASHRKRTMLFGSDAVNKVFQKCTFSSILGTQQVLVGKWYSEAHDCNFNDKRRENKNTWQRRDALGV